ncbi:MAG: SixA phosphatase family protein [Anaerolineae bacterium]|jgi:phosphohistidine phosphatase|nr:histidine phosphatase family protein [Chloroflexota bacterium]
MRTLYVMRHTKSRWDQAQTPDHERKLSPRGKRDARALGRALAEAESAPDLILTSSARRATSTARRVARAWEKAPDLRVESALYGASPTTVVQLLSALEDSVQSVLVVGHNPDLEELVFFLGDRAIAMATGTVVRIDLPVEIWAELCLPAGGHIVHVWTTESLAP